MRPFSAFGWVTARPVRLALCTSVALAFAVGCGGGGGGTTTGSGGATASGGTGSGGVTASGGKTGSGGSSASGGAVGSGGGTSTGGASMSGSGGMTGTASGGKNGSGGTPGSGGGATETGGSGPAGSGGAAGAGAGGGHPGGSGGAVSNGGAKGSGGTSGTAGASGGNASTIVPDPSWTCSMPSGIPSPAAGKLAFTVTMTVGATHDVGNTQFGKRRQLDVSGGSITGDKLKGTVLTGGLDYELTLSTGAMELEEVLILKTSDNVTIFTRVCGVAAPGDAMVRIVPDIEAPTAGSYAWLNTTPLVGTRTVDAGGGTITLSVYDVTGVTAGEPKVTLTDPAGVPNVSWDCVTATGSNGTSIFTENVTLGSTVTVSNAKRGSRNIIPITGGTTTGMVAGKILNGGADYQLASGGGTALDARYTLAPSDGSFIIVRNCGPANGLTPVFEAATDGPYKFLTTGKYLSSSPGAGSGGVSITFYERK